MMILSHPGNHKSLNKSNWTYFWISHLKGFFGSLFSSVIDHNQRQKLTFGDGGTIKKTFIMYKNTLVQIK